MANQFTEISAPFMHIRQLLYIHKDIAYHSIIENVNVVFFFLTFLIGRFLFQLHLIYSFFWIWRQVWTDGTYSQVYNGLERFAFWYGMFTQLSIIFLNINWLQLITKGVIRKFAKKKPDN